jgi:hypothetical protein
MTMWMWPGWKKDVLIVAFAAAVAGTLSCFGLTLLQANLVVFGFAYLIRIDSNLRKLSEQSRSVSRSAPATITTTLDAQRQ